MTPRHFLRLLVLLAASPLLLSAEDERPVVDDSREKKDAPVASLPTLWIAGDSTVTDQQLEPYAAWGQMLPAFFGPGVAVANHAESGESAQSFVGERRHDKVMSMIKPGDYLFIQFPGDDSPACRYELDSHRDDDGDGLATRIFADDPNPFAATCGPLPNPICWPSDHEGTQADFNCR